MQLINRKSISKNKLSLTRLLCIGASYFVCLSCQGMEDTANQHSDSNSKKQRVDNTQSIEDESLPEDNFPQCFVPLIPSEIRLTPSEFLSLEGIIKENNRPGKLNRRVSAGQHQKFQELRKDKFDFEDALSLSQTREYK